MTFRLLIGDTSICLRFLHMVDMSLDWVSRAESSSHECRRCTFGDLCTVSMDMMQKYTYAEIHIDKAEDETEIM